MRMALEFSKSGAAKYISHLDLQRAFSRVFRRSGLPVKLSSGFNPHYVFSFASALPLGIASECECVEINLANPISPKDCLSAIGLKMPPGLTAKRAVIIRDNAPKLMASLKKASYLAYTDTGDFEQVVLAVREIMGSNEIIAIKKQNHRSINIRNMILNLTASDGKIDMLLSASAQSTLRPDIVMQTIENSVGRLYARIIRTGLYTDINGQSYPLLTAFAL